MVFLFFCAGGWRHQDDACWGWGGGDIRLARRGAPAGGACSSRASAGLAPSFAERCALLATPTFITPRASVHSSARHGKMHVARAAAALLCLGLLAQGAHGQGAARVFAPESCIEKVGGASERVQLSLQILALPCRNTTFPRPATV